MSADKDRGIRRQKQKREKAQKKQVRQQRSAEIERRATTSAAKPQAAA